MLSTKKLNELKGLDTNKVSFFLMEALRGASSSFDYHYKAYSIAYVIVKASNNAEADVSSLDSFVKTCNVKESIAMFLSDSLNGIWDFVIRAKDAFDIDMYTAFLLFNDYNDSRTNVFATPDSVIQLAIKILDIKENDNIADFFDGRGTFIRECYINQPSAIYSGIEISLSIKSIAELRADILGENIEIIHQDVETIEFTSKYDKVFADCPMGVKSLKNRNTPALRFLDDNIINSKKMVSLYWLSNISIINTLKAGGKAVTLTNTGSLFNTGEREIRKFFVDNGYIDSIILLPSGLFEAHRVATAIIVLGNNNKGVRFIDASKICTKGRRYNTLSEDDILEIISLYSKDSDISKYVTKDEVFENDYSLFPANYFEFEVDIPNGVEFGTVIKNITRGAQLKASQLDQITSKKATDYKYLTLSDIQNGQISTELEYLSEMDDNLLKYCVKNNSLIVSKIGIPVKTAIASVPDNVSILATGNLYNIELDESKVNPYYIKAFLDSSVGSDSLKSICVGAAMPNISIESLKKMIIPLLPIEEQNIIANNYLATIDEIKVLRSKLSKAEARLSTIFDEGR